MADLDANDLMLFARVAEAGSFSRAAERMQLPKSSVSRRIMALEKRLGERLINRTTRKLTITDFGAHLLEHARALTREVDGALALAQYRQAKPSGRLRVSLPADFSVVVLPRMLSSFVKEYPAIVLEMDLTPRRVDLIGENYDLAVRIGQLPDDSQLAARKLADVKAGLYAAPAYLKQVGIPKKPDDLLPLHGLLMMTPTGGGRGWTLERGPSDARERWQGKPQQYSIANSPAVLMRMAENGFGVVSSPYLLAQDSVNTGLLVPVLPDWEMLSTCFWAVFPGGRLMPARTRVFLDALVAAVEAQADPAA